ncbi:Pseudouridine synthase, RsuA/RluA-like [Dillenia turbinata]|uniref:Pseudouridine synthase, RsuA/RluA-like n=1 Tax=Dillenia turbinata TaxID=194707 RepID=A0AAN8UJJ8_9MAGN
MSFSLSLRLQPPTPLSSKALGFLRSSSYSLITMSNSDTSQKPNFSVDPKTSLNYPKPLSPPLPAISKNIELSRAMSASSRSGLFSLSRNDVLYEDEWLVVVNKPQGVYCDAVLASVPRLFNGSENFDEACHGGQCSPQEFHLANRLDRDTSGVMIITKSHKVAAKLVQAFTDHKVKKTYIALCMGSAPNWRRISIRSGHGRSKFGAWRVYAMSDVGKLLPGGSVVRDMETSFEVLTMNGRGSYEEPSQVRAEEEDFIMVEDKAANDSDEKKYDEILVRAYPRSGRTHQIRLHCQYLGISIRGDVKYEGVHEWEGKIFDGHELHAESLSFEHPVTRLPLVVRAPLPSWARQALKLLPH